MPVSVQPPDWKNAPDLSTPLDAANLKRHDAWVAQEVAVAVAAAVRAEAAADEAEAPTDQMVANAISAPGSLSSDALAAYSTATIIPTAVDAIGATGGFVRAVGA